jgi:hypothetical protein
MPFSTSAERGQRPEEETPTRAGRRTRAEDALDAGGERARREALRRAEELSADESRFAPPPEGTGDGGAQPPLP